MNTKQLHCQLEELALELKSFGCIGMKAEFEAEGSSFSDVARLRYITAKAGLELHIKIGGSESFRDIYDSIEIGADCIVAPMVESEFAALKFVKAVKSTDQESSKKLTLNIETRLAVQRLPDIVKASKGKITALTVGRSDLSNSYADKNVVPDSVTIDHDIKTVVEYTAEMPFKLNIGGSITTKTIARYRRMSYIVENINCIETRKVIFPTAILLENPELLKKAIEFEKLSILYKKSLSDMRIKNELNRLTNLQTRT